MTRYIPDALPAFQHTWRIVCREAEGLADVRDRLFAEAPTLEQLMRLGVVSSVEGWLALRALRNRLVHEYIESPDDLLQGLQAAEPAAAYLLATVDRIRLLLAERAIPES
jgi:hypothetical protein